MITPPFEQTSGRTFEWSRDEPLSTTVIQAVAVESGEDPTKMEELYATIDPDALDALFAPTRAATTRSAGVIEFCFSGYRIRIDAGGTGLILEQ